METLFIYALGLDVLKLVRNTVNAERQWRQHGVQRWRMLNGLVRNTVNAERQWRPSCLIQSGGHEDRVRNTVNAERQWRLSH